ncbi:hypothetical protein D3C85_936060 [compost metagenome]
MPVGQRLAGGFHGFLHQCQVALGVDHHAFCFGPEGAGQEDVGVAVGLGVEVGVLGDDQFGSLQAFDHFAPVGHRRHGIGADDPADLDPASGHLLEHVDGASAHRARQAIGGDAPHVLDERPISLDQHRTLTGQAWAHVAHFPSAHGVRLPGQGKRAAARPADCAGSQVQVAEGIGVPGAVGTLVEPHRPAAHPFGGFTDPLRRLANVGFGEAGEGGDLVRCVVFEELGHHLPAFGERGDEVRVGMAVFHQQMQQAIEQCQIGAGADLQEQAGLVCRGAAPWIDHDQFCPGLDPVHHAQKQDRVTVGHVGTDHEEQIGAVEVFVGARWPVGTQRELVAAARAGHAQA